MTQIERDSTRGPTSNRTRRAAIAATATVGGLLVGGLAVAGALPGASSGTPPVDTPTPNASAGDHPDSRGASADHIPTSVPPELPVTPPTAPPEDAPGTEIAAIAQDPALQGLDKGVAVSEAASGGASRAGDAPGPIGCTA